MGIFYCDREDVKASLSIMHTARADALIDDKIDSGSRSIESLCHRVFYPEIKTVTFDWPNYDYSETWKLYLGKHDIISATSFTAGGTALTPGTHFFLRPDSGPPFTRVEINLGSSAAFHTGSTAQRAISMAGLYGYNNITAIAGKVTAGIDSSVTTLNIKPINNVLRAGVGSLLLIDDERMIVTSRTMADTSQNLQTSLTADKSNTTVAVSDGTAFAMYEVILIDAERMRVVDIAGNNLIVERAFDGTALKAHTAPTADIYALRQFTVTRAALGTIAAAHLADANVYKQLYPALVKQLAVAESLVGLEQDASAYARTVGAGENLRETPGRAIAELRERVRAAHGRLSRKAAI